jgi:hypothetical protein
MNENIRRLLAQAYLEQADIRDTTKIAEHFAELIVKECVEVVEKQKAKMSYGPTFVIEDIKKHFGVEE